MNDKEIVEYLLKYKDQYGLTSLIEHLKKNYNISEGRITTAVEQMFKQPINPPKEEQIPKGSIPKRICALEVLKWLKLLKYSGIGLTMSGFLVMILSVFSRMAGYIGILLTVIAGGTLLFITQKEISRLNQYR